MTSEELNRRFIYTPKYFIILSLILHFCFPVFYSSMTILDRFDIHPFGEKKVWIKDVYQEFVQVDVVALPDRLLRDMPEVDTSLPAMDKVKPMVPKELEKNLEDEKVLPDPSVLEAERRKIEEAKKKAAMRAQKKKERKEREQVLKKLKDEAKREAALKALAQEEGGRSTLKGNILSEGTSTKGKIGTAKDRYKSLITQKIKQHFNIYPWQQKKALVSVVFIQVSQDGSVKEKKIIRPSGDRLYDSAVLQAIVDAQPLPVPVDISIIEGGIKIEFRPEQ